MANDRIYARCTYEDCAWGIMIFKYYPGTGIMAPLDPRDRRVLVEMEEHWDTHDQPRDFSLNGNPGFRLATEATAWPRG